MVTLHTEVSSFQGGWNTLHTEVSFLRGWNREVPLHTEVSSFQGVGIEGSTVYRGVLISGKLK